MVTVSETTSHFIFKVNGWHQFWAFENQIKVEKQNMINAYQTQDEFTFWIGWRMPGTAIPGIITAGTYIKKGKRNFWDVCKKKNTIVVQLQNSSYNKLIIEVENPLETINFLNTKRNEKL